METKTQLITTAVQQTLQDLLSLDREAATKLLSLRVSVNEAAASDFITESSGRGKAYLTVAGLLNTVLGKVGDERIFVIKEGDNIVAVTNYVSQTKPQAAPPPPPPSSPANPAPKPPPPAGAKPEAPKVSESK